MNYYTGTGLGIGALGQTAAPQPQPQIVSPVGTSIAVPGPVFTFTLFSLSTASGLVSAYHGYKRNRGNIGWALAWFLAGSVLPGIVPVYAMFQGFAQPERVSRNRRRARRRSR